MFNLGPQELFWLFLIVLFVFGAKRIPEIGRSIGKGISEFKRGMKDVETEFSTQDRKQVGDGEENKRSNP
jgi:sec-independent protein translocase protein TatA